MKYFSSEEQGIEVITSFLSLFEDERQNYLRHVMEASPALIVYAFRQSLWEVPEAIEMGFHEWMEDSFKERIESQLDVEFAEANYLSPKRLS